MNDLKQALQSAFAAPPPVEKREFLRQHTFPAPSIGHILLTQLGYIRKRVWIMAFGMLFGGILAALTLSEQAVAIFSALTPLLALTLVTECGRSEQYGMAELELSTRLSLKTLVLARLTILGSLCLVILALMLPAALWRDSVTPIAAGLYITTPFLLNTFTGLQIVRRFRGPEGTYGCVGVTACMVCLLAPSHTLFPALYVQSAVWLWAAAAALLCWGIGKQFAELLKQKEELQWS